MARPVRRNDWVDDIAGLVSDAPGALELDPVVSARTSVARLAVTARAVTGVHRDAYATVEDPDAVRLLARDLATAVPGPSGRTSEDEAEVRVAAFVEALSSASPAVYYCRRTQHPQGVCWFNVGGPAADLCGRVLAVGHVEGCATPPGATSGGPAAGSGGAGSG